MSSFAPTDSSDFGSRKRGRGRGNHAAGLAMMGMVAGTIGAVIAAQQQRRAYRRVYYDYPYGHGYGYGRSYAYQQPHGYYAPRAYRHPRSYIHTPNALDRYQYIDPQNPNSANPTGVPRIGW